MRSGQVKREEARKSDKNRLKGKGHECKKCEEAAEKD